MKITTLTAARIEQAYRIAKQNYEEERGESLVSRVLEN
jgi:hypothetical protein